jgi:hypothetical protein
MVSTQPRDPLSVAFDAALERDDPFELQEMVVQIALESEDSDWAEWACARLARHRNANVRGNALQSFGHLARRFGRLDPRRARPLIENGLHAHHEYVREQAASAADDVDAFLSWRVIRPSQ